MSTDFNLLCHICKACIHVGQMMGGARFSSGHGPTDEEGRGEVGQFLVRHDHGGELGFLETDKVPEEYRDEGSP